MSTLTAPVRFAARLAALALAATGAALALPAASAQAAGGTTYFVSPSGSDSNAGTDPGHPFRTLAKVSNGFLRAGDTVLLERGATFNEKFGVWSSGTSTSRITISSYGVGLKPVVTGACVQLGGSYLTMQYVTVAHCNLDGIWVGGSNDVISNVEAYGNVQGINVGSGSSGTKVLYSYLHDNNRMAPNTPGPFDDWGAVGMVVAGDNTEVAYNVITNNWAPSPDFGTDGSAVEIYGGIGTYVHHNVARDNRTFTELGNSRSANTTYAYNLVTSTLTDTEFLITRGAQDYFGPVTGTVAMNNSVRLTGSRSLGYSCYAGCTTALLRLSNNVLDVAGTIGYLQGQLTGGNNIYWRGRMGNAPMLPGDQFTNPRFKHSGLVPAADSPLVDAGQPTTVKNDLNGRTVGVDGNGDGKGGPDIGAYEAKGKGGRAKAHGGRHHDHASHHGGKGGKTKGHSHASHHGGKGGKGKHKGGKHHGHHAHHNHQHHRGAQLVGRLH